MKEIRTVWKFLKFFCHAQFGNCLQTSAQILREINFGHFEALKTAILTI